MIDDANIWRFNVAGSKEVRDYRVKEITFAITRNRRWSWHEITWGLCLRQTKVCRAICKTARWCLLSAPYEWWLDLVAIFRKREYQPWRVQYVLDEMLREIRHQLAQSQQLRPEQAAESED